MDDVEDLKRRLAAVEAKGGRPSAAAGVASGFFGCFGWLAAIVLVGAVVFTVWILHLWSQGVRAEDIRTDGSVDRGQVHDRQMRDGSTPR